MNRAAVQKLIREPKINDTVLLMQFVRVCTYIFYVQMCIKKEVFAGLFNSVRITMFIFSAR